MTSRPTTELAAELAEQLDLDVHDVSICLLKMGFELWPPRGDALLA
jgi:hypothetical protein